MPAAATSITATYSAIPTYTLTVNGGNGGGSYTAGTVVPVTANTTAGYQFTGWTGATGALASVSSTATTLTMPATATAITATYSPIIPSNLKLAISGSNLNITVPSSVSSISYQLQYSDDLSSGSWQNLGSPQNGTGGELIITTPYNPSVPRRFFRLKLY